MWFQIKSYLKFLFASKNNHGIHSPFVYALVTDCFYDKKNYPEYAVLKNFRKKLYNSIESIEVTDFGAGSRIFKSNDRKVSAIAKTAGITAKRQRLLFRLMRYFEPENALELGTSLGMATAAMALGKPSATIETVEGCPNTAKMAQRMFAVFQLKNIRLFPQTFSSFFNGKAAGHYDFVYVDGNHSKEKTLHYFEELLPKAKESSVFIFDDIHWSRPMNEAWAQIATHEKVSVSIDVFYWGLVFFRKGQRKEHFTVRL